ncbi:MAG: AsmA family protein [Pseudanabaena sp. RU_4_16]|nr:AsmA family protein [Pseudanabaena sp. RU_4_16]
MRRRVRKITVGILLGLALALALAWFSLDRIMQWGIEQNASTALGVPTHIGKLNLNLAEGTVGIDTLTIDNPNGFNTPYLLKVNSFSVKLKPMSLIGETVEIQSMELDGLEINVEQTFASSNILTVGEKLQQRRGEAAKQGDRGEKKVKASYASIET